MNLRSRPIDKPAAPSLLAPIVVSGLLLSSFATDIFSGTTVYRGRNEIERLESGTARRITGEQVVGPGNDRCRFSAKLRTPGGSLGGDSNPNPLVAIRGNNSITGFVFSDTRRPIPNIHVELLNDVGATVSR